MSEEKPEELTDVVTIGMFERLLDEKLREIRETTATKDDIYRLGKRMDRMAIDMIAYDAMLMIKSLSPGGMESVPMIYVRSGYRGPKRRVPVTVDPRYRRR